MTQYSGKVIRKTPVTPTQQSASGVWATADAAAAVRNNLWPVPGVPDPISRSVRFRSSASAYFNRTFGTPTDNKKWTWSGWVKRGSLGSTMALLGAGTPASGTYFMLDFNDSLDILQVTSSSVTGRLTSNAVYRDPSAWYHIVAVFDSNNATAANRLALYVNGVQITSFSTQTNPSSGLACSFNSAATNVIGYRNYNSDLYFDGYMAEMNFIDGQALTPSSFGTTDTATGAWIPMPYTGTYGANGFYLNFKDNTSTTTLGYDYSGNSNNWTANNISLTAGSTYDSMLDVPTQWVGYNTGDTTAVTRGNYCVWNAAAQSTVVNGTVTRSNGNLTSADGATTYGLASFGTIAASSGKWYWEVTLTSAGGTYANIGVVIPSSISGYAHSGIVYAQNGNKGNASNPFGGSGSTAYGATYTTGNVIGVALDIDGGTITFYKDGVSQGVAYSTGIAGSEWTPAVGDGQNSTSYTFDLNCGQRPFSYTPPSGFVALNTYNL